MTERPLRIVRDGADAPALPLTPGGELEPMVYEGEILPPPELGDEPDRLPARIVGRVVRPSTGTRRVLEIAWTVGLGWHSWVVRAMDGLTSGVYRRQIRSAEAAGDVARLGEWADRRQSAANQRMSRLMQLPTMLWGLAKVTLGVLVAIPLVMTLLATILWAFGVTDFETPWLWAGWVIRVVAYVLIAVFWICVALLPVVLMVAGHREGRRKGAVIPMWLAVPGERESSGEPITPSKVVVALRDLGVPALRKALTGMPDGGAAMLSPITIAGCGVQVDVTLPSGVSTDEVQRRRRKLAENLGRHEHETFITIPVAARTVRLWIADSGALDEPIGPSPMVLDPDFKASYKTGQAPWGQDLRGDAAAISLYQRHLLITGLSNQGKTASLRALALWLAFDPSVKFRISDLKGAGDWSMFDGIAEVLIQGPTDDHVIAATEMLEAGEAEMNRRLQAPPGTKFDPLILIVDEAQVAFMCPAREEYVTDGDKVKQGAPYGGTKATSKYFMAARKIQNQGRAVDVLLWQGTQNPTDQNLPVLVREGAHIRTCLAVGTEAQSRMALGDKAVDGGAAPHLLRQGLDKGTLVSNGEGVEVPAGQSSITIRTHFIDDPEAVELAERAKALRARPAVQQAEERDLMADLNEVIGVGDDRLRLADLPGMLRQLAPGWQAYEEMTGTSLREILTREYGVKVTNAQNVWRLDPQDFRRVWARLEADV